MLAANGQVGGEHFGCNAGGFVVDGGAVAVAEHLVATTRDGDRSLVLPERAGWLWARLRAAIPEALSNLLMPNHLHMVTPPGLAGTLRRVLTGFTRRYGVRFDLLPPEVANSAAILGRMIRYGFFNPVRSRLTDDPLAWPWSTLRDLVGATANVWTPMERIASILRVSADAGIRALTTLGDFRSPPVARPPIAAASLGGVRDAVSSALRLTDVRQLARAGTRRLIVQVCAEIGVSDSTRLAKLLGCSQRSIRRDRVSGHPAVESALLCLSDPRLRVHPLGLST